MNEQKQSRRGWWSQTLSAVLALIGVVAISTGFYVAMSSGMDWGIRTVILVSAGFFAMTYSYLETIDYKLTEVMKK